MKTGRQVTAVAIAVIMLAASAVAVQATDDENDANGSTEPKLEPSGSGAFATLEGTVGDDGWFLGPVNVTLTAGNDPVLYYRVDGGAWTLYSEPFRVDGDARKHRVDFGSQNDIAQEETGRAHFAIDATDPWSLVNLKAIARGRDKDGDGDEDDEEQSYDSESDDRNGVRGGDDDEEEDDDDRGRHVGWFRNVTLVRLRAVDNTSHVADTFVRVDNGTWETYQGAFFVFGEGEHAVSYYTRDRAGNEEPVRTVRWGVDATPPDSNGTLEPDDPNPDDGTGDGDNSTGDGDNSTGDGDNSTGGGDNSTGDGGTENGTAPAEEWQDEAVRLHLNATDNLSGIAIIKYRAGNGTVQNYTVPILYSVDGIHVVTYYATDLAGNEEEPRTTTIRLDTTPPTLGTALIGPEAAPGWHSGAVTLNATASDALSGLAALETQVNGGAVQAYVENLTFTEEGVHDAVLVARDIAGNTVTRTIAVRIDATAPHTNVSATGTRADEGYFVGRADVTLDAEDAVSGVDFTEYGLDDGIFQQYRRSITLATDGDHSIRFRSQDRAGNEETLHWFNLTVDALPPATRLLVDGAHATWSDVHATNATTPELVLAAEDRVSGVNATYYRVDDGPVTQYGAPFTVTGEGDHVVAFWSDDAAGFTEPERTVTVRIDTVAPVVTREVDGESGTDGWYTTPATVTLNASDDRDAPAVWYALDDAPYTLYEEPITIEDGAHTLAYYAEDAAGNRDGPHVMAIGVDATAPTTTLHANGTEGRDGWYTSEVEVTFPATDPVSGVAETWARVNGGDAFLVDAPFNLTTEGTHTITFWSVDAAGNVEEAESVDVKLDLTAPSVTYTFVGNAPDGDRNYDGPVLVNLHGEDDTSGVETIRYRVNDKVWREATHPTILFYMQNDYVLYYHAVDEAGNWGPLQSVSFSVSYD